MTKSIKAVMALGFVAIVAACGGAQEEEVVVVEPQPIQQEPTFNKF